MPGTDTEQIRTVLASYAAAVNNADPVAVESLYAPTAVTAPAGHSTAVGEGIRAAYEAEFARNRVHVELTPHVIQVHGELAYCYADSRRAWRSTDGGSVVRLCGRDLFVLAKTATRWRIVASMGNRAPIRTPC